MKAFLLELRERNESLFFFGVLCLFASLLFFVLTRITVTQISGTNAWYKPFKFALSIAMYSVTMAWLVWYLPNFNRQLFSWAVILLLGFEIVYITLQAARGQQSHFNVSNPLYTALYGLMAIAATAVSLYTAYVGLLFFRNDFSSLPSHYLWSIRLAIVLFVIFSFEGFVMGSRLSHTIGAMDGGPGLPVVNWSTNYGDPRIAHFIGMHALQVLPLASYYLLKDVKATMILALLYAMLSIITFIQALKGRPFHQF